MEPGLVHGLGVNHVLVDRLHLGRDGDLAWFQGLRHLTLKLDMQHAVGMGRADHLNVVRQMEAALKGAGGDAAVQVGLGLILISLAGRNDQRLLTDFDAQVAVGETGDGDGDAVGIVIELFDIMLGVAPSFVRTRSIILAIWSKPTLER